ncbi:MAG TPA: NAD(P)-dependent oxidoreductase, partial [bacterium]|nr:NAD(P)-dependent oxidoreductase [bacterium]
FPATHHLINSGNIQKIKRGSILINTARGGLVETAALVKALDQGILSGAGLDVLEGEELILEEKRLLETAENKEEWERLQLTLKNHILLQRDNVVYTPHVAFYSKEAVVRILDTTLDNIRGFLAGNPENGVNSL